MRAGDVDYYRKRLIDELERSFDADIPVAEMAHRQLAELYRARLTEPPPPSRWHSLLGNSPTDD